MAIKEVQLNSIAALTVGVLTETKSSLGAEESNCVLTIQSKLPDSPLKVTLCDIFQTLSNQQ